MDQDEFDIFKTPIESDEKNAALLLNEDPDSATLARLAMKGELPLVMIVDDDPTLQQALQLALEGDYRVMVCSSGDEAVEKIHPEIYAVILDIKMQGRDGFQTFADLKKKCPLVPITFHSAYQDLKDPYDIMNDFRPFGYVVKEGNHRLLMDTINSAVSYYGQIRATLHLVDELRSLNQHLEDRVKERTATIEQQNGTLRKQKSQLETQIAMARNIQRTLLPPSIPRLTGARVGFEYRPRMEIGGDFLDFYFRPDSADLGLFICDVSGNGVPAAFLSSMVKMSLREWPSMVRDPAALLGEIHESMKGKLGPNFITGSACHLDLGTGRLTFACAGHPPPLLIRGDGTVDFWRVGGTAIFEFLDIKYRSASIDLQPGDKLLMYTDGATEAHDENKQLLDEAGFLEMVQKYSGEAPDDLCRNLVRDILSYTGNHDDNRPDDLAVLAVEFTG